MVKYRKRVPKALMPYISKKEIVKMLRTKSDALALDEKIHNALQIAKSDLLDEVKVTFIEKELGDFIQITHVKKEEAVRYQDAAKMYMEQSSGISKREYNNRVYFFNDLFPALLEFVFEKNPIVSEITSAHLNKIALIIQKLPSRNYLDLKKVPTIELIKRTMNGELDEYKKLHVETVNKQIKRIRSLAHYGFKTGQFSLTTAVQTVKHHYSARDERKALSVEEIKILLDNCKIQEVKDFIILLYYTGLRVGEVGKFKVIEVDGIECFDLRGAESLKTRTSFRIIPKHPSINNINFSYTHEHLARKIKALINDNLEDTDKKTTYSLRHSFASELVKKGVRTDIVSELLGHRHAGMTLSRYAKGFSVKQLYEAVLMLESLTIND